MSDIHVRLPDGRTLAVSAGASVLEVAGKIGPRLARTPSPAASSGRLVDLRTPVEDGAAIEIVTARDPVAGEVMRHSAEHVMADAVKRLFPDAQVDVGRTDHAEKFQYDFKVATALHAGGSRADRGRDEAHPRGGRGLHARGACRARRRTRSSRRSARS